MATVRARSVVLLLALCFAACACAPAERMPRNRYISYASLPVPNARGGNGAGWRDGHGGPYRRGCSVLTRGCPGSRGIRGNRGPTVDAGSKADHMSHAAFPSDDKHPAPMKAGGAKTGAAGSKGRFISPAALSADKPCGRLGCPSRP